MDPIVWRVEFPQDIKNNVVSWDNPKVQLTNSDLELAVEVLAVAVIVLMAPIIKRLALGTLCDNTPTVRWVTNLASRATSAVSGQLSRA